MIIEKSRLTKILALSLPIVGGMVSQNLMSLIDTAMVGRLGDAALTGVGIGTFLFLLFPITKTSSSITSKLNIFCIVFLDTPITSDLIRILFSKIEK